MRILILAGSLGVPRPINYCSFFFITRAILSSHPIWFNKRSHRPIILGRCERLFGTQHTVYPVLFEMTVYTVHSVRSTGSVTEGLQYNSVTTLHKDTKCWCNFHSTYLVAGTNWRSDQTNERKASIFPLFHRNDTNILRLYCEWIIAAMKNYLSITVRVDFFSSCSVFTLANVVETCSAARDSWAARALMALITHRCAELCFFFF